MSIKNVQKSDVIDIIDNFMRKWIYIKLRLIFLYALFYMHFFMLINTTSMKIRIRPFIIIVKNIIIVVKRTYETLITQIRDYA